MALYQDIANQLREDINNHYEVGELLPPEKQLAERFGVNRHTLRRAVDELVHDGLIRRYQGLGNQVTKPPIEYSLHDRSCFSYNLLSTGVSLETEVLGCAEIPLPLDICKRLKMPTTTRVVLVKTCRYIDRDPATLIHHHLFDVDIATMQRFTSGSLHHFLAEHYDYRIRRGTTTLRARMPNSQECQHLKVGRGVPVMEVQTRNYQDQAINEKPRLLEYSVAISRSDIFEYSLEP